MIRQAYQLDRERIGRLLEAAGACDAPPIHADVPSEEYDFGCPWRLTGPRGAAVRGAAQRLADAVAAALAGLLRSDVSLDAEVSEHFFASLPEQTCGESDFCALLDDNNTGEHQGALVVSAPPAIAWVGRLLGSTADAAPDADRSLSALETALLEDVLSAVLASIASVSSQTPAGVLQPQPDLHRGALSLPLSATDEVARISMRVAGESQPALTLVVRTPWLEKLASLEPAKFQQDASIAAVQLAGHIEQVAIGVEVWLDSAIVTMRDAMALEHGDVLVLTPSAHGPARLVVQDQVIAVGTPAQSGGLYAIQVARKGN
jgi:flagellar motor switch protein FliM